MTQQPSPGQTPASPPSTPASNGGLGGAYLLEAPPIDEGNSQTVVQQIQARLVQRGWQGADAPETDPGSALVQLFGRLAELIIARLNQVPEKHFLAFLNEAGIDLLPPQSAGTELTFTLPEDYPGFVRVPAGTQVATVQTETQPAVIFETQQDINIVPGTLIKCVAFDPINASDVTAQAKGDAPGPFAVFQGEEERERILYLGDDELLAFPDASSRQHAEITLNFQLDLVGDSDADEWVLTWLYWDAEKETWSGLEEAGATVDDQTDKFSHSGNIVLSGLPEITETEVEGQAGLWVACRLSDGKARNYLPSFSSITISREISVPSTDPPVEATADGAFSAIQSGTALVPLDPDGDFFPLGQHPGRLDTFYLRADEAFTKSGASVTLQISLQGVPDRAQVVRPERLDSLRLLWEYHSEDGWIELGTSAWDPNDSTSAILGFSDGTQALTTSGDITFRVPLDADPEPVFAPVSVNDQEGYWLRARVIDGSYDEPGGMFDETVQDPQGNPVTRQSWSEPTTHQPLVTGLVVTYNNFSLSASHQPIPKCLSRVDNQGRDHFPDLDAGRAVAPFNARDEGPALYLGFSSAFPEGEWMQVLLDVAEDVHSSWPPSDSPTLFWEYWNGLSWAALRVSDGTRTLRERGYLGFFGPEGHTRSSEFGTEGYWLRIRQPRPPRGYAGGDQSIVVTGGNIPVTLDASRSQTFDQKGVVRYHWRLLSSTPPLAVINITPAGLITTGGSDVVVTLDTTGSLPSPAGRADIVRYIWRRREVAGPEEEDTTIATPYLYSVRTNIVAAINAVTVREEVLGSSDGKPHQTFTLLRSPVLPGAQIAVREPDRPPAAELEQLERELQEADEDAQALINPETALPGQGIWTRWHEVSDFHFSIPYSRHFTLDPITGEVQFGDGKQGKIPPVGRDNVKALVYRTHRGISGNVGPDSATMLRNPSGDLANIKAATNHQAAGGGSNTESIDQVKLRGPQALKHRQRAVTMEDYEWIAREAGGNLARIRCLPTLNSLGLPEAGWVTVVITPETATEKKPVPTPALLRRVESYLKEHALTNLAASDQIFVKGPEYIEATVTATVVPVDPTQADEVEIAVLQRLETFLHPLLGGPQRQGWELGRDVFISEVYAEIESVPGVDHVASASLAATLQQFRICLRREAGGFRRAPFDVPIGTQVSTFDERVKLLLAEALRAGDEVVRVSVYGFKVGDTVSIVASDNTPVRENLTIEAQSGDSFTFAQAFVEPSNWYRRNALLSTDGRIRIPLVSAGHTIDELDRVTGVTVTGFQPGDKLSVVPGGVRPPELEFLPVDTVEPCEDRIFVPVGHLVFSGNHDIDMALE